MNFSPLIISLKAGVLSTIINLILGVYIAYLVSKMDRMKGVVDGILTLPLVLPPTVVGFFLLIIFGSNSILGKFLLKFNKTIIFTQTATIIASTIVSFPLMYKVVRGAFEELNKEILYVGRTLGLSEYNIFRKIIIPNIFSNIIAGAVLTFARSLGEFGATAMVAGNIPNKTQTMSLAVYSAVQSGNRELAYKWVLLMSFISFIAILVINIFESKNKRGGLKF
ncbi:MAG TPA: molybdate ABC transporter permease subunit [Tissierellaceae bacterium]|nr:molybdate ABC transporter permease subunit [Tissierellaceae bacterium]